MRGEFEKSVRYSVSATRWLLAPMYLGLALLLFLLLILFVRDFFNLLPALFEMQSLAAASTILSFATVLIVASVVLLILQTGFEHYASEVHGDTEPAEGRGRVDFSKLITRLIGATIAVSLMYLLKGIVDAMASGDAGWKTEMIWVCGILGVLVGLTLVIAVSNWFSSLSEKNK